jgi:hypothetical protein
MLSKLVLLVVCIKGTLGQVEVTPRVVMYEGNNQLGQYLAFPQTYVPDLRVHNFDNRAYSACVTGLWVFYVNPLYNTAALGGVEYMFGTATKPYCNNFVTVGGYISSVRFVGSPVDYTADTFTLYEEDYFQGNEEYAYADLPSLALAGNHKSIIITGRSPWTVYDQDKFGGRSICLRPTSSPNVEPYLVSDTNDISIPFGSIRSIKKGCATTQDVYDYDDNQGSPNYVADLARFGKKD